MDDLVKIGRQYADNLRGVDKRALDKNCPVVYGSYLTDFIDKQADRIEALEALVKELVDEVGDDIQSRYSVAEEMRPDETRRWKRDMDLVNRARAALKDTPDG